MEKNYKTKLPKHVKVYIDKLEKNLEVVNKERILLIKYLKYIFETEELLYDEEQIEKYFSYEKYFPSALFDWEKFLFVLHYCVFKKDGLPRWSELFIDVGRGAGKNYYLSWEDFCAITPTHGINDYHIDICATTERQARTSFEDIYHILEDNIEYKKLLERNFKWTQTKIVNKITKSEINYHTNNPKSKDGLRSGAINLDEYHAFENYDNVKVFTTGLGKKPHPRITITTTEGEETRIPLEDKKKEALDVLTMRIKDNGKLFFICKLDDEKEIHNELLWQKANPSLEYFPSLMEQMRKEYSDYVLNPIANSSFMIKRMNIPLKVKEDAVTSWENIVATEELVIDGVSQKREFPTLDGMNCVVGIDYASYSDFASVCATFKKDKQYYCICHSWVCSKSKDLPRIQAPLKEWEKEGLITFVDNEEISPELIAEYIQTLRLKYNVIKIGADHYQFVRLKESLRQIGYDADDKEKTTRIRPSDIMMTFNTIASAFNSKKIVWGNNPLMRWATNNAKIIPKPNNNYVYGKIEPKSRKTDPFMSFVHSMVLTLDIELEKPKIKYRRPIIL